MSKEQNDLEKERKYTRRAFLALIGMYGLLIGVGVVKSCNNRLQGIETICYPAGNRAGIQCTERPILKGDSQK